jgi:hypothetical protein
MSNTTDPYLKMLICHFSKFCILLGQLRRSIRGQTVRSSQLSFRDRWAPSRILDQDGVPLVAARYIVSKPELWIIH